MSLIQITIHGKKSYIQVCILFQIGSGQPPTPRHSHCAIIYDGSIYVFGGYDGSYKSDLHRFNFETNTWKENKKLGSSSLWPRERYRTSACVYNDCMYIYGVHYGSKQLGDIWSFDINGIYLIEEKTCWKLLEIQPNMPSLCDSHVSFVYKDGLYIHGGSSASNYITKMISLNSISVNCLNLLSTTKMDQS